MAKLETPDDIHDWLDNQSREVCIITSARSALRRIPHLNHAQVADWDFKNFASSIILPSFWGLSAALTIGPHPNLTLGIRDKIHKITDLLDTDMLYLSPGDAIETNKNYDEKLAAWLAVLSAADAIFSTFAPGHTDVAGAAASAITRKEAYGSSIFDEIDAQDIHFVDRFSKEKNYLNILVNRKLWPGGITSLPKTILSDWAELKKRLSALNENWEVWINWYENRINGVPLDDKIDLETIKLESLEQNYKQGAKVANAELRRLTDEFYKGNAIKIDDEIATTQQVPGVYAFGQQNGKITAHATHYIATPKDLALEERDELLDLCHITEGLLVKNNADEAVKAILGKIIKLLGEEFDEFPAGRLRSTSTTIAALADIYNNSDNEIERTIGGLLKAVKDNSQNFLGYFPDLIKPEAQRQAIQMAAGKAAAVEAKNVIMTDIASSSDLIDSKAVEAAQDNQAEVAEILDRLARAPLSTQDRAMLNEKVGELVSTRLLTVRNLTAAILKSAEDEKSAIEKKSLKDKVTGFTKDSKDAVREGAIDGVKKTTTAVTIGGFAMLASLIAPEIIVYASLVASMSPFARKAQKIKDEVDAAQDIDIDT